MLNNNYKLLIQVSFWNQNIFVKQQDIILIKILSAISKMYYNNSNNNNNNQQGGQSGSNQNRDSSSNLNNSNQGQTSSQSINNLGLGNSLQNQQILINSSNNSIQNQQGNNSGSSNNLSNQNNGSNNNSSSNNINSKSKKNKKKDEVTLAFDIALGNNNRLEFSHQKQFKRDIYKLIDQESFMSKQNERDISYFFTLLNKTIKTNKIHYDILLEILIKSLTQLTMHDTITNKEIENQFYSCFYDLNNSNCFVDKKVKGKIFYDQTHENIYDQFFEVLQPQNEKNCLKHLIFFRKLCRGQQEIEDDGLNIIYLAKKISEKQAFTANCLDIQVILFISKLWWMITSSYSTVEEKGKSLKSEYEALKQLMGQYKKQLPIVLEKMYAYLLSELKNPHKKEVVFQGMILFILYILCKFKNVLNSQMENPTFLNLLDIFLSKENAQFIFPSLVQFQVYFNSENMMLKNYKKCIAEKTSLLDALESIVQNLISSSLVNNNEMFFKILDFLEKRQENDAIQQFYTNIQNKFLFQSLIDNFPVNSVSSQSQAVRKTQEFFNEMIRRKISVNSCYSIYYLQQLRNKNDIFEFVRQILLHPKESLSSSIIGTLNNIKLLSPTFLKIAIKVANTLRNEQEINYFMDNIQNLNSYLRQILEENQQNKELLLFIQFKDLLMMTCNVLIQQYELVKDRKHELLTFIVQILDILQEYCLEDIDSYQYVRSDIQISCDFIRLITKFLLNNLPFDDSIVQYILIIITSTCLFSQKRVMTLFLELQEQIIGFSIQNSAKNIDKEIILEYDRNEFTQTSLDFFRELNLGIDLSKKQKRSRLDLTEKESLALFLFKFYLKQNPKCKYLSEHSQLIKESIYPKLKDEDIKNNCSLSRKITEVYLFGFKYERNVSNYANYQKPFYSNHPFDEFIREYIIENKFFYSVIYLTCLKADSNSFNEFFMSVMLNLAAMFHNTQFEKKPHWTLRKTIKTLIKRDVLPPKCALLIKYFDQMKNQSVEQIIYLLYDYCMKFKTYSNKNSSQILSNDKQQFKTPLKHILMNELKTVAKQYQEIITIFD
ncbi:hypothetical protein ABPG74_012218 [Tetrahymena malaccensis]